MNDAEDKSYINASERILPKSLQDNKILIKNWKDGASDA
jgi:hypothetical protein